MKKDVLNFETTYECVRCAVGDDALDEAEVDVDEDDDDAVSQSDVSTSSVSSSDDITSVLNAYFAAALAAVDGNTFSTVLRKADQMQEAVVNLSSQLQQLSGELKAVRKDNVYLWQCLRTVSLAVPTTLNESAVPVSLASTSSSLP